MNIFSGNMTALVTAVYRPQNRKTPLGVTASADTTQVEVFVDESYRTDWQNEMNSQNWDVLVYGQPGSILENESCVGGTIEYNGRKLRIETYAVTRNQRKNRVEQVELGCSRI